MSISIHTSGLYFMSKYFLQEDSEKTGKVTSAGMYFLHFQVYRMDSSVNAVCVYHFNDHCNTSIFINRMFQKSCNIYCLDNCLI